MPTDTPIRDSVDQIWDHRAELWAGEGYDLVDTVVTEVYAAGLAAGRAAQLETQDTVEQMVREFHIGCNQIAGSWRSAKLRHELFMSEVKEFNDAVAAGDLVETADAIADICYVLIGTAIELGIPFDKVFAEVHRSNMTKLIPPVSIREDGKVCKGPHFDPPHIAELLGGGTDA